MPNWWENTLPKDKAKWEAYKVWIGDHNNPSKKITRKHVADHKYKSILDCGSGLCTEYDGYREDNYRIHYVGIDFTKYIVDQNIERGIPCVHGKVHKMNMFEDNTFEVVYARHLLEHMAVHQAYEAISEMIRIARREVIIVWFIPPSNKGYHKVMYSGMNDSDHGLYHNEYSSDLLKKFLRANHPKYKKVEVVVLKDDQKDMYPEDEVRPEQIASDNSVPSDDGLIKESIWFIKLIRPNEQ